MKKENQKKRYIAREYKKFIKEIKKNPPKRFTYSAEHEKEILEKMPHLSDLRDELKDQNDEGLMAYVKENVPIDSTALETQEKKKVSTGSRKLDAIMAHYRY